MKNRLLLGIAAVGLLVGQVQADTYFLETVDTDVLNGANYSGGVFPSTAEQLRMDASVTGDLWGAATNHIQAIIIAESAGTMAVLNIHTNGQLFADTSAAWDSKVGQNGHGTLNIVGGHIEINFIEVGRNIGSTGIVNMVSGYYRNVN
ncbi:MAG: hypothetical protein V5783_00965 [Pontiella sp.]